MSSRLIGATLAFVVGFPLLSLAGPVIDFTTLGGGPGTTVYLGSPQTAGNITATAYVWNGGTDWGITQLTVRNQDNDHGLGVCSEGTSLCDSGTGDVNEISQLTNSEALLLSIPSGYLWSSLWVSSLDDGGSGGSETGTVYWGTTNNIAALLSSSNHYTFTYTDYGTPEADIFGDLTGFDPVNRYLLFVAGGPWTGATGSTLNNDYLIWGGNDVTTTGDVPVPEPGSLSLLGLGLVGLARKVRRRIHA